MDSNIRRFATRTPTLIVAAVLAEVCGAVGTAILRQALGISGIDSVAIVERFAFVVLAAPPAAVVLSRGFTGRWWSWWEAAVATVGVTLSFWLGPILLAPIDGIGRAAAGDGWPDRIGSELVTDPIWGVAILLAYTVMEFYVWRASSLWRIRDAYGRFSSLVRHATSADPRRAQAVRHEMDSIERIATVQTGRLADAIGAWADAWLDDPEGPDATVLDPLSAGIHREMVALYGEPITPPPDGAAMRG